MTSTYPVPDRVRQDSRPRTSIRQIAFGIGVAVFLVSFFLPALGGPGALPGWWCAWVTLAAPFFEGHDAGGSILFACGLINPLLLSHLLLRTFGWSPLLRRAIAFVALAFIPLNWIFMASAVPALTPAIGHFAWIAGLLLILVPETVFGPVSGPGGGSSQRQRSDDHA